MSHPNRPQSIQDKISEAIKKGEVAMKPRWHFAMKSTLALVGATLLVLALIHVVSLGLFVIQQNGTWFAPSFGFSGIGVFATSLPWMIIILVLIFVVLLEFIVKHYRFAYRRPLLYSVLTIIVFAAIGGIAVAKTPLHQRLEEQAHAGQLPIAGRIYKSFEKRKPTHIHSGTVDQITDTGFGMETRFEEKLEVIINTQTKMPRQKILKPGQNVVIMGKRTENKIHAKGVRSVDRKFHKIPKREQKKKQRIRPVK